MRWSGSAKLGLGWGLFQGEAGDNTPHEHHAVQIVLSAAPLRIWSAPAGWRSCVGAVIGADVRHQIEPSPQAVTLIYLEPDSPEGQALATFAGGGWRELDAVQSRSLIAQLQAAPVESPARVVVQALGVALSAAPTHGDALIAALLRELPRPLPARLPAALLARRAGLSVGRLQHRLRAHTGMALRPYLRWLRLLRAMEQVAAGGALTDAALEAGFADAAHFSRTCRRHFGITPRALLKMRFATPP